MPDHDAAVVDRYLRAVQAGDAVPKGRYDELELQFVTSVRSFSIRNGISYGAWRDVGVALDVLERAGLFDPESPDAGYADAGYADAPYSGPDHSEALARPCTRSTHGSRSTAHGRRAAHHPHPVAGYGDVK